MSTAPLYDLAPMARIAVLGVLLALLPLGWLWMRHRHATPAQRLRALTLVTLFLTFDLVLFGAFTRLTDSGLGCPDWPGCYGSVSPLGAHADIHAAQTAMPTGPVTFGKAWIEMVHRYLATGVGVLITVLAVTSWTLALRGRRAISPWWATVTLVWVCMQGAFGALTVTMKLYPAIVTLHLLGGLGLLALLAAQAEVQQRSALSLSQEISLSVSQAMSHATSPAMSPALYRGCLAVAALSLLQIALGGWVSTNYAVLACRDFPTCQGSWWPEMDFAQGFRVWRELGAGIDGYLPFTALTAIHVAHRLGAGVALLALTTLAWRLHASGDAVLRRWALALGGVALWQLLSGLSNVVLGWPLLAAVAHTGGAAALVVLLTTLIARARPAARSVPSGIPAARGVVGSAS